MNYSQYFLQVVYGGKDSRPKWQKKATNYLQQLNLGYHPGRFINCIEISMQAFKSICLTGGELRSSVTPLPNFPPFIKGYLKNLNHRFGHLENEMVPVNREILPFGKTYQDLNNWIIEHNIPPYSHFILFTNLKQLPGGHVISGIVLPSENDGPSLFLYDAQGFIPDSWLASDQFDSFYSIDLFYVYQSESTRHAVKQFVHKFQECEPDYDSTEEETSLPYLNHLHHKIQSFLQLELFRLNAKQIVAAHEDELVLKKMKAYQIILDDLRLEDDEEISYTLIARSILETAKIAKQHAYSMNWLNPQSLNHYTTYFKTEVNHSEFCETPGVDNYRDYLIQFLMMEIIRICMINEYYNHDIEQKVIKLINCMDELSKDDINESQLFEVMGKLQRTCCEHRHTITWFSPQSAIAFETYIKPIQQVLKDDTENHTHNKLV